MHKYNVEPHVPRTILELMIQISWESKTELLNELYIRDVYMYIELKPFLRKIMRISLNISK